MSSSENPRAAWLPTPSPDQLPAEVAAEIQPIADRIGFVPNIARLLAITPGHFVGWWRYFDELMRGPSNLTKTQREMIAVVVSRLRQAGYADEDILHITELTAIFNYNGRLANGLGLVANKEYHGLGRIPQPSD